MLTKDYTIFFFKKRNKTKKKAYHDQKQPSNLEPLDPRDLLSNRIAATSQNPRSDRLHKQNPQTIKTKAHVANSWKTQGFVRKRAESQRNSREKEIKMAPLFSEGGVGVAWDKRSTLRRWPRTWLQQKGRRERESEYPLNRMVNYGILILFWESLAGF